MANSRIARFIMEVAPPQYVTVMRHRTSKMLDTIREDEREFNSSVSLTSSHKSSSASSSASAHVPSSAATSASAAIAASANNNTNYFLKEVHRSLPIFTR